MSSLIAKADFETKGNKNEIGDKDLIEHVLSRICWVSTTDFLDHVPTHCVDGRGGCAIVGAPGGDAGEFLLMLASVEKLTGQQVQISAVGGLFKEYLQFYRHFYMHTDAHMLGHLADEIVEDAELGPLLQGMQKEQILKELENVIRMPPTKIREKLLKKLVETVKLGCGHLSLMREHESEYGVRLVLVNAMLEAFYRALWAGERVEWEVLAGEHAEKAVVNILAETDESTPKQLPLVVPNYHGEQVFVNHPQAETLVLEKSFDFADRYFGAIWPIDREEYIRVAGELMRKHTMETLRYLAKGLPIYEAHVTPEGDCSVHHVGIV
ncbi:MAG: hypothetical protein KatS3mg087_0243 [Patescibacteria group bacterium]|nr:MAG: hypothetical protein KatS3mg087_0243 [Patescibacteria group bacterium]